jgi:stearoyl-CoA 9-desaturase NADPH oxidoreductase
MAKRQDGYQLHEIHTADQPRFEPSQLDDLVPDWRERETFLSGPREMMDEVEKAFADAGRTDHLHQERFQPVIGNGGGEGTGGKAYLRVLDTTAECGGGESILVGAENAGAKLQFGCRMGICHTCVGRLAEGTLRDLRNGSTYGEVGEMVRICISCPEGHVEIDL